MKVKLPQHIDKKQWLARMGVSDEAAESMLKGEDEALLMQMQQAEEKLFRAATPQGVYRIMDIGAMELPGTCIKKHLEGCHEIAVLAVTLGAGVERLIRMSQIRDMAEAVVLDSGASILADQLADELENRICNEDWNTGCGTDWQESDNRSEASTQAAGGEIYFTGRYSPGYGDFPIEMQKEFISLLDAHRKIGLSVNESHILIPRKSVTAIMGAADHPVTGYLATCEECLLKESCTLRKEGKQCWT